jgi:hypothetical protein
MLMLLGVKITSCAVKELVCSAGGGERVTAVQHAFHTLFGMKSPNQVSIYACWKTVSQKLCIGNGKSPGLPSVSDSTVDLVWACIKSNPQKICALMFCVIVCKSTLHSSLPITEHTSHVGVGVFKSSDIWLQWYAATIHCVTSNKTLRVSLSTDVSVKF